MAYHKHKAAAISDGRYGNTPTPMPLMNRSSVLRHHRVSISRHHIPHKSSPYVGWFRHAPAISSHQIRHCRSPDVKPWSTHLTSPPTFRQEKLSPYVGWFRHSPPSNLYEKKNGSTSNMVDLNVTSTKKGCCDIISCDYDNVPKKIPRKHCISGRLPGGSPVCHHDTHLSSVGVVDKAQDTGYSRFLSSQEGYTKQEVDPLTSTKIFESAACSDISSAVLTKFANWFLFPIVNDERVSSLTKDNIGEVTIVKGMTNMLLPYLSSALKRFFSLEDRTTKLNLRGAVGTTVPRPRDDLSETDVSEYSDYDSPRSSHRHSCRTGVDENSQGVGNVRKDPGVEFTLPVENHPIHISVSSLAEAYYAEQVRQEIVDQYPHSNFNPLASLNIEDNQCLDYSISQIDITRMVRNASRHLDVESILKLPSITYKKNEHVDDVVPSSSSIDTPCIDGIAMSAMEEEDAELGWSWVSTPEIAESVQTLMDKTIDAIEDIEEITKEKEVQEEKCVICLEQFGDGDRIRVLPCGHSFHMGCIDKWLSGSFSHHECFTSGCPTCKKTPNVIDNEEVEENALKVETTSNDSVPSWAFANLGGSLAMEH